MSKWISGLAIFVAACATTVSNEPVKLTLATATPGGGFTAYGEALAAVVREVDPTITIEPKVTKGSGENIPLLDESKIDLALVAGEPAHEALTRKPPAKMKAIAAMYPTAGFFVVRADSPYRTIEDLRGKPIAWGARASGFIPLAGFMLEPLGLDRDRDFQPVYLERVGDGPAMLRDGKVAALWGGGVGFPAFVEASKMPGGARFIAPSEAQVRLILVKHPQVKAATIPANSYAGQTAPLASVGSWSFIYARHDLPDDLAYRVARALHRAQDKFAQRLPQARESTAANTYAAVANPSLIHPGALRYLREAGVAR